MQEQHYKERADSYGKKLKQVEILELELIYKKDNKHVK